MGEGMEGGVGAHPAAAIASIAIALPRHNTTAANGHIALALIMAQRPLALAEWRTSRLGPTKYMCNFQCRCREGGRLVIGVVVVAAATFIVTARRKGAGWEERTAVARSVGRGRIIQPRVGSKLRMSNALGKHITHAARSLVPPPLGQGRRPGHVGPHPGVGDDVLDVAAHL